MAAKIDVPAANDRELVLARIIDAPRENVFRCWTEVDLLKQWFAPAPWSTPHAELDVRTGGSSLVTMRSPEGQEFPYRGTYLEVVKNQRIVSTDAFTNPWEPSEKPFMLLDLSFEAQVGKTRYIARVRHWSVTDRVTHEQMGFYEGWGKCTEQLEALAQKI
jgi:uncharacterized protein YndB with AHSA1/START domain